MKHPVTYQLIVLPLLFLLSALLLCEAADYYVKPTEDTPCPGTGEPCLTLMQYVQKASKYFRSGVVMKFLPGDHNLTQPLAVANVTNFALVSANSSQTVTIFCGEEYMYISYTCKDVYLQFEETNNLTIEGLQFFCCGTTNHSQTSTISGSLQFINVVNVQVSNIVVFDSWQEGISGINAFLGNSSITHSRFQSYYNIFSSSPHISITYSNDTGTVTIPSSNILRVEDAMLVRGGGGALSIVFDQLGYSMNISIINMTTWGFNNSRFDSAGPRESGVVFSFGAGPYHNSSIYISKSWIKQHSFGGVRINGTFSPQIIIEDSIIEGNYGSNTNAAGLTILGNSQPVILKNVAFFDNMYTTIYGLATTSVIVMLVSVKNVEFHDCKFNFNTGSVGLRSSTSVRFSNCNFENNSGGSAILADNSTFTVSGTLSFNGNGFYGVTQVGSALSFYENSYMLLENNTVLLFNYNYASHVGGAIYIDEEIALWDAEAYNPDCFIKLASRQASNTSLNISLIFKNNTAEDGGNDIYGGLLHPCKIFDNQTVHPVELIKRFFHFDSPLNMSFVTSRSSRVCLCSGNGKPDCPMVFSEKTVHPGENFTLPAVVVGERFGAVQGSVYAMLNETASLGDLQNSQSVGPYSCTELQYTIYASVKNETLVLTVDPINTKAEQYPVLPSKEDVETDVAKYNKTGRITKRLLSYPVVINITLLPCPLGFKLDEKDRQCVCHPQIQSYNTHHKHITCNINDHTIHLPDHLWMNASFNRSDTNGVIIGKYCRFDYCKSKERDVNLEHPDTQCAFNRSGILCGGCKPGLSLALGSSQCLPCTNKYLALLIPFAIAGIILVFLIKLLNLTVSKGTINGLIFYANIVGFRTDQTIFFPANHTNPLTIFIAWLNLDLGIETCFFDGLDGYWKTWLQFVFPLYVWTIAGIIVVVSHCSPTATRVFGRNSMPVLATLFLLSYAKLLRTIIAALFYSTLDYPEALNVAVWSVDGNIRYRSSIHIPLLLVAIAFLLLLWLPYTVILTFGPCLQRLPNRTGLRWVVKLKPFFDANFGPFKDKHRYWAGVLLLIRGALFLTFAFSSTPTLNPLIVCITCMIILMYTSTVGNVYKSWYLSTLESSFILNLGILSGVTVYTGGNQAALVYTSVGIVFVTFIGIVIFHIWKALGEYFKAQPRNGYENIDQNENRSEGEDPQMQHMSFPSAQLREPLIEDRDSINGQ